MVDPLDAYLRHKDAANGNGSAPPEPDSLADVPLLLADGSLPSVPLASIDTAAPPPMLIERMDPEGHTILFGTGGVGKGALACYWIAQLARAGHGILILDYERHPAEWSRRIASLSPDIHASGLIRHMTPKQPLHASAPVVAAEAREHESTVIVVDSAVMACGSDPLKPDVAALYADGVMQIGLPVLSLAHVTKADDMRYPFGSIFWHNLARTTWGLQADQSGTVVLSHRKHNNYASLGRFAVVSTWMDGRLMEVYERDHAMALKDRIADVLRTSPMSLPDLIDALNEDDMEGVPVKRESVRRVLNREMPQTFRLSGGKYEIAS